MSQRIASPKFTAPPPPMSHARQPTRFTAKVMLFTANTHTHTEQSSADTRDTPRTPSPGMWPQSPALAALAFASAGSTFPDGLGPRGPGLG